MKTLKLTLLIGIILFFCTNSYSQAGYSSGSFSTSKNNGINTSYASGLNPEIASTQVIVEEFMNYHKHAIKLPVGNDNIALDVRWGNKFVNSNTNDAVLQIGLATKFDQNNELVSPVNICFVIDRSGSMSSDNRLIKVKVALSEFIKNLRPNDVLSIVSYGSEADVVYAPQKVGDKRTLIMAIESIQIKGGTNLNAGMMVGYQQVLKNYDATTANKVILLTDGCATEGETNSEIIINNSKKYNNMDIGISTIGVGYGVNQNLLHQLAKNGKGANHFIGSAEDIQKVFIDEAQSLLSPIAKSVKLTLEFDEKLQLYKIFGYSPKIDKNKITFDVDDINSCLTQVFLFKFNSSNIQPGEMANVKVHFSYYDIKAKRKKDIHRTISLALGEGNSSFFLADNDVRKNYTIALMAQALKDMVQSYCKHHPKKAHKVINDCLKEVYTYYPTTNDKDIVRILEMVEKYKPILAQEARDDDGNGGSSYN